MRGELIAIVGATATGKTALAVALSEAVGGEVINADSRQVYRGMDIGTAKPSAAEQAAARHWVIDRVAPDQPYTLASFLDDARAAIADIAGRGRTPIVAGGTGQYVWALLEGWRVPRVPPDITLRQELEALAARAGAGAVATLLRAEDPESADSIDRRNVRRMIRAIEVTRSSGRRFSEWQVKDGPPADDLRIVGLSLARDALYARIDARVDAMLAAGLAAEVAALIAAGYDCDLPAMSGIGYRQMCGYLRGETSLDAAAAEMKTETHRLTRMQHAWFRRDDARIAWLDASAPDVVGQALHIVRRAAAS
ncbi:MAG: tRNA (adenosine(37)-N6)-dimethylallyltransferase MiaA [Dehalococcoidia bacterium]|nr:tRNA (adenosine(37)-N6)-dimethylallyltransferase MiaA [Dehalococcoidia bacterium]